MPHSRSVKKRMRQSSAARERNRAERTRLRNALKLVRQATSRESAAAAMKRAEALLDRAARKHLIHRNTAARHKARLSKVIITK